MSPSRMSPLPGQSDREVNTKERGDHQSPTVIAIRTPPMPNITPLDPDHRNPRTGSMYNELNKCFLKPPKIEGRKVSKLIL